MEQFVLDVRTITINNCELLESFYITHKTSHLSTQKLTALVTLSHITSQLFLELHTSCKQITADPMSCIHAPQGCKHDHSWQCWLLSLLIWCNTPARQGPSPSPAQQWWPLWQLGRLAWQHRMQTVVGCVLPITEIWSQTRGNSFTATSPLLHVSRISIATVMSEQWGPDKEASGDQVCGAWLVRACLDSLTLLPVYLRCIFLLCWLLLPGRCSSL